MKHEQKSLQEQIYAPHPSCAFAVRPSTQTPASRYRATWMTAHFAYRVAAGVRAPEETTLVCPSTRILRRKPW
jgi:hypothetical protein